MRVGFLVSPGTVVSGRSNGVRQQALIWRDGLARLGVEVVLINPWDHYNWEDFELLHIFQGGDWLRSVVPALAKYVRRLVFSPIIDTVQLPAFYRVASSLELRPLRIRTENAIVADVARRCDLVLARSAYEYRIINEGLGVEPSKVAIQHIAFRELPAAEDPCLRKDVCLHVSSYYQPRKNVVRLIEACKRIGVPLWLVGNAGATGTNVSLERAIAGSPLVRSWGFLSDQRLRSLMAEARVFALPSLNEGVGLSAMEAALAGCEIVITSKGGPRDYFSAFAQYVEPRSVNSIAAGILTAMRAAHQPELRRHISDKFSTETSSSELYDKYRALCLK